MRGNSPSALQPDVAPDPLEPQITASEPVHRVSRRHFLLGATIAAGGISLYGNEISRHEIETTYRTFRLKNLHPVFDGFRIVQISDIHMGQYTEDFFLKEVIGRVNAIAPDMVLLTGDFCSRGPLPMNYGLNAAQHCAELLTALTCSQRFSILGNHDAVVGPRDIRNFLENNGTPMLVNQYVPIERDSQRFWLGGLDDTLAGHPDLELALPPAMDLYDTPIVLMCHEPDYLNNIYTHTRGPLVDLVLSGHTHGGQIRLPGTGPLLLPPGGKLYPEGHFFMDSLQLYVNRGIGTVGVPLRLNCPAEITVATLHRAT